MNVFGILGIIFGVLILLGDSGLYVYGVVLVLAGWLGLIGGRLQEIRKDIKGLAGKMDALAQILHAQQDVSQKAANSLVSIQGKMDALIPVLQAVQDASEKSSENLESMQKMMSGTSTPEEEKERFHKFK
jgi:uncharacterized protein YoxC